MLKAFSFKQFNARGKMSYISWLLLSVVAEVALCSIMYVLGRRSQHKEPVATDRANRLLEQCRSTIRNRGNRIKNRFLIEAKMKKNPNLVVDWDYKTPDWYAINICENYQDGNKQMCRRIAMVCLWSEGVVPTIRLTCPDPKFDRTEDLTDEVVEEFMREIDFRIPNLLAAVSV
ncbi:hypothetical protein KW796_02220 [Candidatus Parcubacteria bacterium]|nr:hypothetical protein [Candidatus Parcubacteria bacterium]